jgi:UDP:flavonoid glycosyltransferase YjiC (YdhE family)
LRISILTAGSRGDVQPYVALGKGLQSAGHSVRVVTHDVFETFVRGGGLDFALVGGNPHELMKQVIPAWRKAWKNPVGFVRWMNRLVRPMVEEFLAQSWEGCRDAEAILFSPMGTPGYHIAESLGVPSFFAAIQPVAPTRAFPSPVSPPRLRLGGAYNRKSFEMAEQMSWYGIRKLVNHWRVDTLGIAPLPLSGPYRAMRHRGIPVLHGYSPAAVPRPGDWPETVAVTGYWFLDSGQNWEPPAALRDFLASGPPPVTIGFGTTFGHDKVALHRKVAEALRLAGRRGVLLTGMDEPTAGLPGDPGDLLQIEGAPHDWLYPRSSAVVHHGGAGTTGAGLRAGVPNVIIPFFYDHPFWGRRVAELGVGPAPLSLRRFTAADLAAALRATESAPIRERAAALGATVRAENGVARVVEIVERVCAVAPRAAGAQA